MRKFRKITFRWLVIVGFLASYLGGLLLLWLHEPGIARENGLMENLQAAALAGGMLICFIALFSSKQRDKRFILLSLVLVLLVFFLRELDVEDLDLPGLLITLGSGAGRDLLLGFAALVMLAVFIGNYQKLWPAVIRFLQHEACIPFYLGGLFYLAGGLFDKSFFDLRPVHELFFEEICENAATYFLILGAFWVSRADLRKRDRSSCET